MRTTAIAELRRGVSWRSRGLDGGDRHRADNASRRRSADVRRPSRTNGLRGCSWIKALIFASLVLFWVALGFIALVVSYDAAAGILSAHHFPPALVGPVTVLTSLMDMQHRRADCDPPHRGFRPDRGHRRFARLHGRDAAILTPDLWIEPLGALVKTGPAIVLMLVALLMLDNR